MASTTAEAKIAEALNAKLVALVLSPVLTIEWPNVTGSQPAGVYLRVDDMRNVTGRPFIANDAPSQHQGIYQISVVSPINVGEIAGLETAGKIADWFQNARLSLSPRYIDIYRRPDVVSMKDDANARWLAIVSVNWRAFV